MEGIVGGEGPAIKKKDGVSRFTFSGIGSVARLSELVLSLSKETRMLRRRSRFIGGGVGRGS